MKWADFKARLLKRWLRSWTRVELWVRVSSWLTTKPRAKRVFFPGCSLPAADPKLVLRVWQNLRGENPDVALWSDCCGMPNEKFVGKAAAARYQLRLATELRDAGVEEIIVACGNCQNALRGKAFVGLKIRSVFEVLQTPEPVADVSRPLVVHHPCSARVDPEQQTVFLALADRAGWIVQNRDTKSHPLPCCLRRSPAAERRREALAGSELITYCGHCTMSFQRSVHTTHALALLFGVQTRFYPKGLVARARAWRWLASRSAACTD